MANFMIINWEKYGKIAEQLAKKIMDNGEEFDLAIGIARGGVPLTMVIADKLGVKMDIINVKSYVGIAKRKRPNIVSTITSNIKNLDVLVIDDLIDGGDTMKMIIKHLAKGKPNSLKTAVLFKKPESKFNPNYCLRTVKEWVVFPWERGELSRIAKD